MYSLHYITFDSSRAKRREECVAVVIFRPVHGRFRRRERMISSISYGQTYGTVTCALTLTLYHSIMRRRRRRSTYVLAASTMATATATQVPNHGI